MSVSRYQSRHPMFFYHQLKAKVGKNDRSITDEEATLMEYIKALVDHYSWRPGERALVEKQVASLSSAMRRFIFDIQPSLPGRVVKAYQNVYMTQRNDFMDAMRHQLKKSRETYDSSGTSCMVFTHAFMAAMIFFIASSFLLAYRHYTKMKPMMNCTSLSRCDLSKISRVSYEMTLSEGLSIFATGYLLGLVLAFGYRVLLANAFVRDRDASKRYKATLFSQSSDLTCVEEDFDNLIAAQDDYAEASRWTKLIARPRR